MPINAEFTFREVLDRGIVMVPDVLERFPSAGEATRSDIDEVVKSAFGDAVRGGFDTGLIDAVLVAVDPLARATAVIAAKYAELDGPSGVLGTTAGVVSACPDGFGFYRHFRHGSIFWHPVSGAHEVHGPIRAKWAALGWERSVLGYPTSDQRPGSDEGAVGVYSTFQRGAIHWYPPGVGGLVGRFGDARVDVLVAGPAAGAAAAGAATIGAATIDASAIGTTTIAETAAAAPLARDVFSGIDVKTLELFDLAERLSEIGDRTAITLPGDQVTTLGSAAGAFEVHGEIATHYRALGGSASVLGYPTTDESAAGGRGRFNRFQAGTIFWTAETGAHEMHGLIEAYWRSAGGVTNASLGAPISDELIPDRRIGHRFPERRKKPGRLPPDVLKLPAEAVLNGFPASVSNVPVGDIVLVADDAADSEDSAGTTGGPLAAGRIAGRLSPSVLGAAGAFGRGSNAIGGIGGAGVRVSTTGSPERTGARPSSPTGAATRPIAGRAPSIDIAGELRPIDGRIHIDPGVFAPGSPSTAAPNPSLNRFGDFEDGVVFWRRGASSARELQPWATSTDGRDMRRTAAEVVEAFTPTLKSALSGLRGASYSTSAFVGTTGYSYDGASVHNRAHRVRATMQATKLQSGPLGMTVPIPTVVAADLLLESAYSPDRRTVVVYLADWSYSGPAALTASPPLERQLHDALDGLLYRRVDLIQVPDTDEGEPIALLSAKTLRDGSVVVYIEPDDPLVIVGPIDRLGGLVPPVLIHQP